VTRPAAASDGGELAEAGGGGGGDSAKNNRMSVFEPFPMRDTVQHFCEKHLGTEGRQRQTLFFQVIDIFYHTSYVIASR
jgi:hypothetical protein